MPFHYYIMTKFLLYQELIIFIRNDILYLIQLFIKFFLIIITKLLAYCPKSTLIFKIFI